MIDYDRDLSETESGPFVFADERTSPSEFMEGMLIGGLISSVIWAVLLLLVVL